MIGAGRWQQNARRAAPVLVFAASVLGLSGCGEIDQKAKTEKIYSEKKDAEAYDNTKFAGDKSKWESAMVERSKTQNEYNRTDTKKPGAN